MAAEKCRVPIWNSESDEPSYYELKGRDASSAIGRIQTFLNATKLRFTSSAQVDNFCRMSAANDQKGIEALKKDMIPVPSQSRASFRMLIPRGSQQMAYA